MVDRSFLAGFKNYKLWWRLALTDLSVIYRRSILGVAWIMLSFLMFIGVKIFVFGRILPGDGQLYALWVTIGYALWQFVQNSVLDGANIFITSKPWILGTRLPFGIFVAQSIARHVINLALVSIVAVGILLLFKWQLNWTILTSFVGLVFLVITSIWVHILLGVLCSQNRDLMHLARAVMHVMFFLTPILYIPSQLGTRGQIVNYNPFTHYIALVRDPIAYGTIPYNSWIIALSITALGFLVTYFIIKTRMKNVAFWV